MGGRAGGAVGKGRKSGGGGRGGWVKTGVARVRLGGGRGSARGEGTGARATRHARLGVRGNWRLRAQGTPYGGKGASRGEVDGGESAEPVPERGDWYCYECAGWVRRRWERCPECGLWVPALPIRWDTPAAWNAGFGAGPAGRGGDGKGMGAAKPGRGRQGPHGPGGKGCWRKGGRGGCGEGREALVQMAQLVPGPGKGGARAGFPAWGL